jgi:ElaB/YqjD/DUF883 family membrane-anchored ribosome-binding protein
MEPDQTPGTPTNGAAGQAFPTSATSASSATPAAAGASQDRQASQSADRGTGASSASSAASSSASAPRSGSGGTRGAPQKSAVTLRSELSNLKNDLDSLVTRAPSLSDEELSQAHARLMQQFSSLRFAAKGIANQASRQLNRGVETTTEYMKERPVQSVAVAIGAGVLLGMLMKRR